ncbi:MAG: hypothetical protein MI976_29920 [Pseudomonadales bacterium]|nr:hypothetical protein [Pseudomonadales bacterium]
MDENGESLASLSAAELGGESLIDIAANDRALATLARTNNKLTFQVMNTRLEIEQTHSLTTNSTDALFGLSEDTLCYAAISNTGNERRLYAGSINDQGLLWEKESLHSSE